MMSINFTPKSGGIYQFLLYNLHQGRRLCDSRVLFVCLFVLIKKKKKIKVCTPLCPSLCAVIAENTPTSMTSKAQTASELTCPGGQVGAALTNWSNLFSSAVDGGRKEGGMHL